MSASPDELTFGGARPLRGNVRVPGDKSISHRALLFAALADGTSRITNLATGDDARASADAIAALGVDVAREAGTVTVQAHGIDAWREPGDVIDFANSGTAIRVFMGALSGRPFFTVVTGDASVRSRPMGRVAALLREMGARIDGRDGGNLAPLAIHGVPLHGRRFELPVASAQVKTALVLAGLQASDVTEIVSPAQSRDHTERMLGALGAPVETDGLVVRVRRGQPRPMEIDVPGDPSSAAFFAVAAAITPGSDLVVESMSCNPTRIGFVKVLQRMGADVELSITGDACGEPVGDLRVRASTLSGTVLEGDEIPNVIDEIPVLAVAGAFASGVTEVRDAAELAVKESNRITAMEAELSAMGIGVEARGDGLVVRGGAPHAAEFASHGDHRIAMAMAVAANALAATSTVRGWRAVESSYPGFAADLARLTGVS